MLVTLVDDSVPFTGYTPAVEPLGGAEKAFASLPGALARRGHVVRAYTRTPHAVAFENVSWLPLDGKRPAITEVLIAYRKASLLQFSRATSSRILWLTAPAQYLDRRVNRSAIERVEAALVFLGRTHRDTLTIDAPDGIRVIEPGVRAEYIQAGEMAPAEPPRAVVTTHPLHGLDWLLELWVGHIRPSVPAAELHIYSAALNQALRGREVPEGLRPVCEKVLAARAHGIVIEPPRPDVEMAEAYRLARVHLYPGAESEMYCATLAESQACGVPAVVRPLGAASERIIDGETGYVAPDDEAFARLAGEMLRDDQLFRRLSEEARRLQRLRSWDAAAAEFETLFR